MADHLPAAERLAQRLDQALPPGDPRIPQRTSDPLVNTALLLARTRPPALSPEADARIEGLMLAAYRGHFSMNGAGRAPRRLPAVTRWLAAACVVMALLVAGLVPASASSVPGDALYPVKRTLERVELALATTPAGEAQAHLRQAGRRADEAQTLLDRGLFDGELVTSALVSLNAAAREALAGGDAALLDTVQTQTIDITSEFSGYLQEAAASGISAALIQPAAQALQAAVDNDTLLLPPPPAPTMTPQSSQTPLPPAALLNDPPAAVPGESVSECARDAGCQPGSETAVERRTTVQPPGLTGGSPPGQAGNAPPPHANANENASASGNANGSAPGGNQGNPAPPGQSQTGMGNSGNAATPQLLNDAPQHINDGSGSAGAADASGQVGPPAQNPPPGQGNSNATGNGQGNNSGQGGMGKGNG